jgi:hypothetical protein
MAELQERHSIGLAIRREVGRRYRKILLAGGKPEGSSKLWQQVGWVAGSGPTVSHAAFTFACLLLGGAAQLGLSCMQ